MLFRTCGQHCHAAGLLYIYGLLWARFSSKCAKNDSLMRYYGIKLKYLTSFYKPGYYGSGCFRARKTQTAQPAVSVEREYKRTKGDTENMSRKSKYLSLILGLILLVLTTTSCVQITAVFKANKISGRVVLADGESGLAGVSILIVDGISSYVETNAEGYFETSAFSSTVIIPRKTGYRFVPEKLTVGDGQDLEFTAYPWEEPDFANWGVQFSFDSHLDWVEAVALSADEQYIATGSNDRTIRIWRTSDGQLVRTMVGHTSGIKVIAFSPEGRYLASAGKDGQIKIWDWQAGLEIKTLNGHSDIITGLAWSPDGTRLASASWDRKVAIWDFATGNELNSFTHEGWVRVVAWSPDGQFVLSSGDDSCLKIWQVELGVLSAEFEIGDKVMSLSAAPDGSLAAVVLGSGAVKVIDFETGAESSLGQYPSGVSALSWSFDGRYLAAGTARQILIWDWEEQKLVQSINAENEILALGWGRKSHLLASGSHRGIIDLWSAQTGANLLHITGHTRAVKALAWSPQGDSLASAGDDGTIRIWDLVGRKEKAQLRPGTTGPVEDLAWSPDGTYLASGGHDYLVRVWNITKGEYLGAFTERIKRFMREEGFEFAVAMKNVSHEDIVFSISWAPNGKKLASASWDQTVAIWDVASGKQRVDIRNRQGWITTVAWSPHGDQVAFGGYDQVVHIYNGASGKEIKKLEGHGGWIRSLAWSPDGRHLASSDYDRKILIWNLETGQIEKTLIGDESVVTIVEWSPCGRYLAGGTHNGNVFIWDARTGEVVYMYPVRVLGLQALAWSPKSDQLAIPVYNSIFILGKIE